MAAINGNFAFRQSVKTRERHHFGVAGRFTADGLGGNIT